MTQSDNSTPPEQSPNHASGTGAPDIGADRARPSTPRVVSRRRRGISWIWLVPLVVALVGVSLMVNKWMNTGPTITISFDSAEGLEVGQTKIRYKNVVVGVVKNIQVSKDRDHVLVKARLSHDAASYITRPGTKFWVVKPRLGINGVSGLGTLFSGAFIGVDADTRTREKNADAAPVYTFKGLEKPPEITDDKPGTRYTLTASDLGSIELGSPVYYRQIQVGRVVDYSLAPDGKRVKIQIFVEAPNDKFVTTDARFWNASGLNLSLNADGFSFKTGSLASVIAGGIAFAPKYHFGKTSTQPAKADAVFALKDSRQEAMADAKGPAVEVDMKFYQSVRGLKVGAPVDFQGLELGNVTSVKLKYDRDARHFYVLVKTKLYPMRSGTVYKQVLEGNRKSANAGHLPIGSLISHGLRAQLRVGNLLTGQQYIALDFFPKAKPVVFDEKRSPILVPTVPGNLDRLQEQLTSIAAKINAIPYEGISNDLRTSLQSVTRLANELRKSTGPQAASTLKAVRQSLDNFNQLLGANSGYSANLSQALAELSQAAKSLRALADYLQAHPSSLLRGHPDDVLPPAGH